MKSLLLALLLAVPTAHAQMYKCVDPGGKTRYSDKPITDCKGASTVTAPPAVPEGKAGSGKGKGPPPSAKLPEPFKGPPGKQDKKGVQSRPSPAPKAPATTEYDKKYASARCRELKEEETWLRGPRSANVENREARLGQVRQSLANCR